MRLPLPARLALPAAAIAAGASTLAPAPATTPVKPWDKEEDCSWWLSADDGNSLRASIGIGDDTLVLSLADKVFLAWHEEDRPRVELWFNGDARRRFETKGWSSHVGTETAIFGLYLDAKARRALAGASSLEVRRNGKRVFELALAKTPGRAELEACIPTKRDGSSDSE